MRWFRICFAAMRAGKPGGEAWGVGAPVSRAFRKVNGAGRMLTLATLVAVMLVSAAGISSAQGKPATGAQFARAHQVASAQVVARSLTTGLIDEAVFPSSNAQVRNKWLLR